MILLFWSYSLIPLSQAMAISFTTPLFMYLGSIIFFKEKALKPHRLSTKAKKAKVKLQKVIDLHMQEPMSPASKILVDAFGNKIK